MLTWSIDRSDVEPSASGHVTILYDSRAMSPKNSHKLVSKLVTFDFKEKLMFKNLSKNLNNCFN